MYTAPHLWNACDYLHPVDSISVQTRTGEAEFRNSIPCDRDSYELCSFIMRRDGLQPAANLDEAIDLYKYLRAETLSLCSVILNKTLFTVHSRRFFLCNNGVKCSVTIQTHKDIVTFINPRMPKFVITVKNVINYPVCEAFSCGNKYKQLLVLFLIICV